jgi:hypothetical protein
MRAEGGSDRAADRGLGQDDADEEVRQPRRRLERRAEIPVDRREGDPLGEDALKHVARSDEVASAGLRVLEGAPCFEAGTARKLGPHGGPTCQSR